MSWNRSECLGDCARGGHKWRTRIGWGECNGWRVCLGRCECDRGW